MTQALGMDGWLRHEERLATMPNVTDIGLGTDAVERCRMGEDGLGEVFREWFHRFAEGSQLIDFQVRDPDDGTTWTVRLYVRRRGRSLDVGTRQDFTELGWERLCDALDARTFGLNIGTGED